MTNKSKRTLIYYFILTCLFIGEIFRIDGIKFSSPFIVLSIYMATFLITFLPSIANRIIKKKWCIADSFLFSLINIFIILVLFDFIGRAVSYNGLFKIIMFLISILVFIHIIINSTVGNKLGSYYIIILKKFITKLTNILNHKKRSFYIKIVIVIFSIVALLIIIINVKNSKIKLISVTYSVNEPELNDYEDNIKYPLYIEFNGSVANLDEIGKSPISPIIFEPSIKGEWLWSNDNTLVFRPTEFWEIGTKYSVKMNRENFSEYVEIKNLKFSFDIEPFKAFLRSKEFYIDPKDSSVKRVTAELTFNFPVEIKSLEDKVTISPNIKGNTGSLVKKNYSANVTLSDDKLTAYIVSEPVGMPADNIDMNIEISKGINSIYGGNGTKNNISSSVVIPGVSTYVRVENIELSLVKNKNQLYDQVLTVETKGDLSIDSLLKSITVVELPVDKPALPGLRAVKNNYWYNLDEMVPEVIKLSKDVKLEYIPTENPISSIHSFKIDVDPSRYLYIKIKEGTRFYGDYFLGKDFGSIINIQKYPREVSILSSGSLLSLSGDKLLPIMTRGIGSVDLTISRIRPDDLNHLVTQSNGRIDNINFNNYNFNEYNISESYTDTIYMGNASDPRNLNYASFSLESYLKTIPDKNLKNGIFYIKVRGSGDYYEYSDRRLIMVTDLGFIVKSNSDETKDLFVQSIATGAPVYNATVEVWGINGNPIYISNTGSTGRVTIPKLNDDRNSPTVFVVKKGNDLSFMPYDDYGQVLDYSNFDIGGIYDTGNRNNLNAYLFSDRGLYKPGDTFNIGMIIKAGDWDINLKETPLEVSIKDPKGTEIYTKFIKLDSTGFEELNYTTQDYSPTGNYTISLYVIKKDKYRDFLGSTKVKVEEFVPDNLKVSTSFKPSPSIGWVSPEDLQGNISVKNLFGTAAVGNDISLQLKLAPGYKRFIRYNDYKFFNPYLNNKSYEESLGEYKSDNNGELSIPIDLSSFEDAAYNVTLNAEVFEKSSGRSVVSETTILVSPTEYLIGYKSDGSLTHINKSSDRSIDIIAIDSDLNKVDVNDLTLQFSENRYISSLVKEASGLYKYHSVKKEYEQSSMEFKVSKDGSKIDLPTTIPGEFSWKIIDGNNNILTKGSYTVIGDENTQRSLDKTAELEISMNKSDFKPGEEIELFIKGPYKGAGLITIEKDKVYNHVWFYASEESTTASITVPDNLEGNGYVTVSLIRDKESKEIYMTPFSYGVVPFSVSKESRTDKITLEYPSEVKPGEIFPITYTLNEPGKVVIYAVDMGILQVADYKTPDPVAYFFKKRALEVQSSQILDLIIPEFSLAKSLSATGGGAGSDYLSRNLNPFKKKDIKPVTFWSGILDGDSTPRTVEYKIPDYFNGTLKIMAVSVSQERVGSISQETVIRSPIVLEASVPKVVAPGDIIDISVTASNLITGSGDQVPIKLEAKSSKHFVIVGGNNQIQNIDEGKDKTFRFKVKSSGDLGAGEIKFTVTGGGETFTINKYTSVRPIVPYRTFIYTGAVKTGIDKVDIPRVLYDEFSTRTLSVSYLPVGMALGLNTYLDNFPYGCTEQITSATFPKLYPGLIKNLNKSGESLKQEVENTISILQSRQKSDGGFGLWTSLSKNYNTVDNYVMFFLTLAKERGYFITDNFFNLGLDHLKEIASSDINDSKELKEKAFSIYILSLNEIVTTSYIEKIEKEIKEYKSRDEFTSLYLAGSYALLQQQGKANGLINSLSKNVKVSDELFYYDNLSYPATYLYIISKHAPEKIKLISEQTLLDIADILSKGNFSTFSAGLTLLGIEAYLNVAPDVANGSYNINEILGDTKSNITLEGDKIATGTYNKGSNAIEISGNEKINIFYQVVNAGFNIALPEESHNGVELYREYLDSGNDELKTIHLGDEINIRLRMRSTSNKSIYNMAIVEMIPAGFELDIDSIRDNESSFNPEYVDIREDRVILYGTFTPEAKEFTFKVKAINTGIFNVPPTFTESMYDQSIWSIKPMNNLTIEPNS